MPRSNLSMSSHDRTKGACGYIWQAPLILPLGGRQLITQECVLTKGHAGDHCSSSKVTVANVR